MKISLEQREKDKLQAVIDILEGYSRLYNELIKGKQGSFFDKAGTAANAIKDILNDSKGA